MGLPEIRYHLQTVIDVNPMQRPGQQLAQGDQKMEQRAGVESAAEGEMAALGRGEFLQGFKESIGVEGYGRTGTGSIPGELPILHQPLVAGIQ
ncbi:MAG: hypothetical protein P8166_14325 [Candidatus Thiodiazotropha sp.]